MADPFRFVPRKGRAGVYFNDGILTFSAQCGPENPKEPHLVAAAQAAFRSFWRTYYGKDLPDSLDELPEPAGARGQA